MQFEKGEAHTGAERCERGDKCFTSLGWHYCILVCNEPDPSQASESNFKPKKQVINSSNNGLHVIKNPFKNVNVYDTRL